MQIIINLTPTHVNIYQKAEQYSVQKRACSYSKLVDYGKINNLSIQGGSGIFKLSFRTLNSHQKC